MVEGLEAIFGLAFEAAAAADSTHRPLSDSFRKFAGETCLSTVELPEYWANRLRRFRSGDRIDAATMLALPGGAAAMAEAIRLYLDGWSMSEWADDHEIEFIASELADLWPVDGAGPDLTACIPGVHGDLAAAFQAVFVTRRHKGRSLADEIASDLSRRQVA